MKVLKVENYKTGELYFTSVEDNDNRIDPLGLFSASFMTITNRHKSHNVTATVLVANISKEQASVEVIKQRKLNPNAIKPIPQVIEVKSAPKVPKAKVESEIPKAKVPKIKPDDEVKPKSPNDFLTQ